MGSTEHPSSRLDVLIISRKKLPWITYHRKPDTVVVVSWLQTQEREREKTDELSNVARRVGNHDNTWGLLNTDRQQHGQRAVLISNSERQAHETRRLQKRKYTQAIRGVWRGPVFLFPKMYHHSLLCWVQCFPVWVRGQNLDVKCQHIISHRIRFTALM